MSDKHTVTISIVSHGNNQIISLLLCDLSQINEIDKIIITVNIPDVSIDIPIGLSNRVLIISNENPMGFGKNHNNAFKYCVTPFFCVMNPDIRIISNPFQSLIQTIAITNAALVAPLVFNSRGELEDSFRRWITPLSLVKRYLQFDLGTYDKPQNLFQPDWIAGMFLLFNKLDFSSVGGFDESYYLYCEDMDLCHRLKLAKFKLFIDPFATIYHEASRSSRKKFKYTRWHIKSLFRFWKIFYKYKILS